MHEGNSRIINNLFRDATAGNNGTDDSESQTTTYSSHTGRNDIQDTEEIVEESLSLSDKEVEMIKKALEKFSGKRKMAARELGISERTLYRKIKEYGIES
jgi:DNA-binding NtrC family response regulator